LALEEFFSLSLSSKNIVIELKKKHRQKTEVMRGKLNSHSMKKSSLKNNEKKIKIDWFYLTCETK